MAKKKPTKMWAVLGRCRRSGRWSLATRSTVLAFLGTCHLDMEHSSIDGDQFKMKVTVFLGAATFVLPEGAIVKPSGMSILAGSKVDVPEREEESGLPTLEIEWTAILGRLQIITASEATAEAGPVEGETPEGGMLDGEVVGGEAIDERSVDTILTEPPGSGPAIEAEPAGDDGEGAPSTPKVAAG